MGLFPWLSLLPCSHESWHQRLVRAHPTPPLPPSCIFLLQSPIPPLEEVAGLGLGVLAHSASPLFAQSGERGCYAWHQPHCRWPGEAEQFYRRLSITLGSKSSCTSSGWGLPLPWFARRVVLPFLPSPLGEQLVSGVGEGLPVSVSLLQFLWAQGLSGVGETLVLTTIPLFSFCPLRQTCCPHHK